MDEETKCNVVMIDGIEISCFPDNDGGYWYYHPKTGEVMHDEE